MNNTITLLLYSAFYIYLDSYICILNCNVSTNRNYCSNKFNAQCALRIVEECD